MENITHYHDPKTRRKKATLCNLRLEEHLENKKHFPHQLIGYRKNISTQDLFLILQNTLLQPKTAQTQALLAIDIKKAFDNLTQDHILKSVPDTGCGTNMYN
ncbi:hypothetical protein HPB49_007355 [Dermacentor silvarum]|uniref:Uncharacterized protein n=1 Tax=Dermacentor silvarum TaxID=543639 RepID=A0ACB8D3P7_DERSI|nr:hypothetical protein HPB49_007355 [Dermacentor silvarum]